MSGRFVVVGAGTMGLGIAYVAAGAGLRRRAGRGGPRSGARPRRPDSPTLWERAVQRGKLGADGGRRDTGTG